MERSRTETIVDQAPIRSESRGTLPPNQTPPRASRFRLGLIAFFIVALFVFLFAIGTIPRIRQQERTSAAAKAVQSSILPVNTVSAARAPAGGNLQLPADIQAIQVTTVSSRSSGYLRKYYADIGDRVKTGQLLAEVDAPESTQDLEQARANLQQARAALAQSEANLVQAKTNSDLAKVSYQRYQDLVGQGVISQQDLDTRKAAYDASVAAVNAQQANVNAAKQAITASEASVKRFGQVEGYTKVYAPFAGVITARNVDVGSLISGGGTSTSSTASSSGVNSSSGGSGVSTTTANPPSTGGGTGGALYSIARIDTLRIFVDVPQAYVGSIHQGDTAQIIVREFPDKTFTAKIIRTSNALDSSSRTLLTELQMANANQILLPGMYAEVKFDIKATGSALRIPANALVIRADGTQVATVTSDGKVHFQTVVIGTDYGPSVDIVSGLQEGTVLIVNPGDRIREGVQVQTTKPNQGEPATGQAQQR